MKTFYLVVIAGLFSCGFKEAGPSKASNQEPHFTRPAAFTVDGYQLLKQAIHEQRLSLSAQKSPDLPAVKAYLYAVITDSIFSYWYGTHWDFNGVTQTPRTGTIACGYFVTTALRDAGLSIARVKLAQAPSSALIKAVCSPQSIRRFSNLADLKTYLKSCSDSSLLILGLDNHVGFVVHERQVDYFVDAGYYGDQVVAKTILDDALPVQWSRSFMIGDLLANESLIRKWAANH